MFVIFVKSFLRLETQMQTQVFLDLTLFLFFDFVASEWLAEKESIFYVGTEKQ